MTTVQLGKLGLTHYDNKTAGGYTLFVYKQEAASKFIDDGGELVHEWNMSKTVT